VEEPRLAKKSKIACWAAASCAELFALLGIEIAFSREGGAQGIGSG
jgi:hypothetical protein